jgi:hypothetical protein
VTNIRTKLQKPKAKDIDQDGAFQDNEEPYTEEDEELIAQKRKRDEIKREIMELQREMKGMKNKKAKLIQEPITETETAQTEPEEKNDMLVSFHQEQKKHASKKLPNKGGKGSSREAETMALLAKFKEKLGMYVGGVGRNSIILKIFKVRPLQRNLSQVIHKHSVMHYNTLF